MMSYITSAMALSFKVGVGSLFWGLSGVTFTAFIVILGVVILKLTNKLKIIFKVVK
jgi:hypothetical protein